MRKASGFTLVELMVVVALVALVMSMGMPAFSKWKRRHDIIGQTKRLYQCLSVARMEAFAKKKVYGVWWGSSTTFSSYTIKADENGDGDVDDTNDSTVLTENPAYPWTVGSGTSVAFNGRGFASSSKTFRVSSSSIPKGALDCVTVSRTRIRMGIWNGSTCVGK